MSAVVVFERRAEEDRNATIEKGHIAYKDVDYAVVSAAGSVLNVVEYRISPKRLDQWRKEGKQAWIDAYALWKERGEATIVGTPLSEWPGITPAQIEVCRANNLLSVESVADADENALRRLGMGGRNLKHKAIAWLQAASSIGIGAERIVALEAENAELKERNKDMEELVMSLNERMKALEAPKKRGRPAKVESRDPA
ncbi:hypothetical protein JN531_001355 [Flagellatimonas centrodinii]|uniref:hypothetical protein n=1 Tax=Flagellatimonas centrodinii TaxID=2806210 RepID=UPI001FEF50E0|nr:hypothetical protein [Flagellatimonas centrodinii]ULQ46945.1 hypothetical protein JN531_001355 [Flagellatimonas centrodinii]